MSDVPSIAVALNAAKSDVGAVGKDGVNKQQSYNFRGVDAVVNAAAPALNKHGVIVRPRLLSHTSEQYETRNGAKMRSLTGEVEYTFTGPAGDSLTCTVLAESSDSGDKAAPKMMSVAYRIALLQVLNLPTDDPDPDATSHERAASQPTPTGPDWAELGWRDEAEHDRVKATVKAQAGALDDDAKAALREWADNGDGPARVRKVMSRDEVAEWEREVLRLASTYTDGGEPVACLACGSTADPCECAPEGEQDDTAALAERAEGLDAEG